MHIAGFQKLTLLDFPGEVACIIFTPGCNFRCPFCHNSELIASEAETDSDAVFSYLKKRKGILDGVVITGGEPLIHSDIDSFISDIRAMGYKIKLDTNGSYPDRLLSLIDAGLLDYVAMDVKHTLNCYALASGTDNEYIVKNIEKSIDILKNCDIKSEFRTTFVKGIHNICDAQSIARHLNTDRPYYIQNYKTSPTVLMPKGLSGFDEKELREMEAAARQFCPNTQIRA